jgi:DNA-binding XRE family transcriptional regulator
VGSEQANENEEDKMLDEALDAKLAAQTDGSDALPPPEERARIRKALRLKQADVADILGVHRLTVGAWERGKYEPEGKVRASYIKLLEKMKERLGETGGGEV